MNAKKSVLGRGLGALIEDAGTQRIEFEGISKIDIALIDLNPFQPRTAFDEESLKELADSIKKLGIIQPITVRKISGEKYQLISGERRLRASKLAGLDKIAAFVRETDDQGMLEMALVENIQREDLDSIEIAVSYQRLIDECNLTQEELSLRVGKQRSTVANYLRLLKLPPEIQLGLRRKKISMGHARALININKADTQLRIFGQIIRNDYSVRKVEELVRSLSEQGKVKVVSSAGQNPEVLKLRKELSKHLAVPVDIKKNQEGKGKIVISFSSEKEFNRITKALGK